ncbi:MAG: hypothetical protein E6R04_12050 [Spirochaetes bacterium]|nr:MAG: hypothetical protein E6R04_12050 [Spirochaetota bacterium]
MTNTWPDGTPKSTNNAFTMRDFGALTTKLKTGTKLSAASTATIARKRAAGTDQSTIVGLSAKSEKIRADRKRAQQ